MSWDYKVSGCFGFEDQKFALHSSDRARAQEALKNAMEQGIDFDTYIEAFRSHLNSKGCNDAHIKEQLAHVADVRYYLR